MCCGISRRCSLNPVLLWLWCKAGSCSSNSAPSLGTSICYRCSPLKKKKKKKKLCAFISCPCLTALPNMSSTTLNKNGKSKCLVSNLKSKPFSSSSLWRIILAIAFLQRPFIRLRNSFYSQFTESLHHERMLLLQLLMWSYIFTPLFY